MKNKNKYLLNNYKQKLIIIVNKYNNYINKY